jgi:PAS domain S-box-containing protein
MMAMEMNSALMERRAMEDLAIVRERYLAGETDPEGVRPVVRASWERSRTHGIDPRSMVAQEVDAERLDRARARCRAFLDSAEPFLDLAHEALSDQPHLFALADRDGLILRILTGPGLAEEDFEQANLVEGASWHEGAIGCNGVGTALATGEAVILIGPEHFQESYVGWTCIGVPIRANGEIIGALDLSVPNEHTHVHTWGWVLSIAKGIEAEMARNARSVPADPGSVVAELRTPFHSIHGVFDLLARQLDLAPTHAEFLESARASIAEAEELVRESVSRLQESEERLRRIAESGMVGVIYWEMGGRITSANDRFLQLIGRSREDLEAGAIDWREITPPEWEAVDQAAIEQLEAHGSTRPFEKEFVRGDGTRIPVLLSAATFSGTQGRGVTLVHDMTERKRADDEIRRLYEKERLAVSERDHLLAVVSHDLRNPLYTIDMVSSLLLRDIPEEKKQAQVAILGRAAKQMRRLVDDLLDVARIESGALGLSVENCRSGDLAQAAIEFLRPLAEAQSVTLRVEKMARARVRADRDRILQVFTNLISNAIEHTPEGGSVSVNAEVNGSAEVLFSVRDTGRGIAPEELPLVFDRFWQSENAGRGGAGLGLAIAKGIVEAHGGRIRAESEPGRGSMFHFSLPLA